MKPMFERSLPSADKDRKPIRYDPPKPDLTYMGRFHLDLCAPIWELGATSDAALLS